MEASGDPVAALLHSVAKVPIALEHSLAQTRELEEQSFDRQKRCAETRSRVLASREQAAAGIGPASRGCATSLDHEGSPDEAGAPDFASEEGSTSSSSDSGVKLAPFEGKVVEGGQARDIVELASFTTSSSGSVHTLLASPTGDLLEALASAPASYFDRSCSEAASLARARQDHNTVALADQKLHVVGDLQAMIDLYLDKVGAEIDALNASAPTAVGPPTGLPVDERQDDGVPQALAGSNLTRTCEVEDARLTAEDMAFVAALAAPASPPAMATAAAAAAAAAAAGWPLGLPWATRFDALPEARPLESADAGLTAAMLESHKRGGGEILAVHGLVHPTHVCCPSPSGGDGCWPSAGSSASSSSSACTNSAASPTSIEMATGDGGNWCPSGDLLVPDRSSSDGLSPGASSATASTSDLATLAHSALPAAPQRQRSSDTHATVDHFAKVAGATYAASTHEAFPMAGSCGDVNLSQSAPLLGRASAVTPFSLSHGLDVGLAGRRAASNLDGSAPGPTKVGLPDRLARYEAERTYCLCGRVSFGEMVCCDSPNCGVEWFHFQCVGLDASPEGEWLCPICSMLPDGQVEPSEDLLLDDADEVEEAPASAAPAGPSGAFGAGADAPQQTCAAPNQYARQYLLLRSGSQSDIVSENAPEEFDRSETLCREVEADSKGPHKSGRPGRGGRGVVTKRGSPGRGRSGASTGQRGCKGAAGSGRSTGSTGGGRATGRGRGRGRGGRAASGRGLARADGQGGARRSPLVTPINKVGRSRGARGTGGNVHESGKDCPACRGKHKAHTCGRGRNAMLAAAAAAAEEEAELENDIVDAETDSSEPEASEQDDAMTRDEDVVEMEASDTCSMIDDDDGDQWIDATVYDIEGPALQAD